MPAKVEAPTPIIAQAPMAKYIKVRQTEIAASAIGPTAFPMKNPSMITAIQDISTPARAISAYFQKSGVIFAFKNSLFDCSPIKKRLLSSICCRKCPYRRSIGSLQLQRSTDKKHFIRQLLYIH